MTAEPVHVTRILARFAIVERYAMTLLKVGQVVVYSGQNPRLSMRVFLTSDVTRLGRQEVWSGVVPLEPPTERRPREWLLEALEQLPKL